MSLLGRLLVSSKCRALLSVKTAGNSIQQRHVFVIREDSLSKRLGRMFSFNSIKPKQLRRDVNFAPVTRWMCSVKGVKTKKDTMTLADYLMGPPIAHPNKIGEALVAVFCGVGITTLGIYGMHLSAIYISDASPELSSFSTWQAHVRERLRLTYAYFGCSTIWTALAACGAFKSRRFMRALTKSRLSPPAMLVATVAVQVVSGTAVMFVPYNPGFGMKQLCWILNASLMGITLAPMCYYGGAVLVQAYLMTCGIIAGLSMIAFCAPDKSFLRWSAPLAMALGCCMAAALSSFVFPAGQRLGFDLMSFYFYGGLVAFAFVLFYDTEKIIYRAERIENNDPMGWDPINSAMSLYMDALNIFVRLIQLFVLRQVKEFRRSKQL